jgi:glycosyltransferase involved in cell wall biosynthesis
LTLAFVELLRLDRRRRYETVQVHNVPDFLVFAALGPKLAGARVILDLHDLMPEFMASRRAVGLDNPIVRLVALQERLSCAFADRVITVTEPWRQTLIARGVPKIKTAVVMNLPDPGLIPPVGPDEPRREPPGPVTMLYHGTLTQRYGIDTTLRAFAAARAARGSAGPNGLRLIVHGRGEALDDLRRLAAGLGVSDVVEFSTRFMPTSELPSLLARAHMAVVTYRRDVFTDGILPTKLLEYAAVGVPTIAGRTPATVAAFDSSSVRFVDGEDVSDVAAAMLELAGDPERRSVLSRNARAAAARRTWNDEAVAYREVVDGLAASARRS